MNRRDALFVPFGLVGGGSVKMIPKEPEPLAFVLTLPEDHQACEDELAEIRDIWKAHWLTGGPISQAPPRLIILPHGAKLEAIVDPRVKEKT